MSSGDPATRARILAAGRALQAAAAARSLGCDAGLAAVEAVIRAGVLKLGSGMLEKLLAADPGYRGPRVPCGGSSGGVHRLRRQDR